VQLSLLISPKNGARLKSAPLFIWRATRGARFYNLQVYRGGRKILSVWPFKARYKLGKSWKYSGRSYRLRPGAYTWVVWPAYGKLKTPRYGKALGQSTFRYTAR
jgi:hypothetical protein